MDDAGAYRAAFQALSDKNRMDIVKLLSGGELCGCQINEYFHISQPTLSHHMKILCASGLIVARREATMIHYRLNTDMLARLSDCFSMLANARQGRNEELPRNCCKQTAAEELLPPADPPAQAGE